MTARARATSETHDSLTRIESERAVLGSLILDGSSKRVFEVAEVLGTEDWYRKSHAELWRLLVRLAQQGKLTDLVTVLDTVRTTGRPDDYGGLAYVAALPDNVPSTENVLYYAHAVRDSALRRAVVRLAGELDLLLKDGAQDPHAELPAVLQAAGRRVEVLLQHAGSNRTPDGPDPLVRGQLSLNEKRRPRATLSNLGIIFSQDPRWRTLRLNQLGDQLEWKSQSWPQGPAMRTETARWLAKHYEVEAGGALIEEALLGVASATGRAYHPVREYLESLKWDEEPRIHRLLTEALGGEDLPLHQAYLRRFLISAVARALTPGCKVDTALILVGTQGAKKSTFFKTLFGADWFGDSPIPIGDKDAAILLRTVWGYEAAEMEDLSRRTAEAVKQFLSTAADLFRTPFERNATHKPRHSVLCGSTNKPEFLTDETGSRRFWPLTVPKAWTVPIELLRGWRDQLWAEAVVAYRAGERWWFEREEEADLGRAEDVSQYQERDPWEPDVRAALQTVHAPFTGAELLVWMKLRAEERNTVNVRRVARILVSLGYESKVLRQRNAPSTRRWVNPGWPERPEPEEDIPA